jgi:DNA-directed RNA polymerase subunit RPC12/RpoP
VLEAVRNAPTKCGTCGASIAAQITKGMTQLTCEYCGSVIRL